MKIRYRQIIGAIDNITMILSASGEENFALHFSNYSLELIDRGVNTPFWSLKKDAAPWPITLVKGWASESLCLALPDGGTLIVDPLRVIVSMSKAYPVQYTGHNCTDCGAAFVFAGSEVYDREYPSHGVDYSYQHCPFCGAGDYIPGFEPNPEEPEAPQMEELEYAPEFLELREV